MIKVQFKHVCAFTTRCGLDYFYSLPTCWQNLHNVSIFLCPASFILHVFYMNNSNKETEIQSVNRKRNDSKHQKKRL